MKKIFLFAAIAAAVSLTSCSDNDDIVSTTSSSSETVNAIKFTTDKNVATRATYGEQINSVDKFYVTSQNLDGNTYFENVEFNLSDGVFSSVQPYYWPTSEKLHFAAVNEPATWGTSTLTGLTGNPSVTFTNMDSKTDIVAACKKNAQKALVTPLTFEHITASSSFSIQPDPEFRDCKYVIKDFRIIAANSGTFNFDLYNTLSGKWSNASGNQKFELGEDGWFPYTIPANVEFGEMFPSEAFFLIPGTTFTVEVEYEIYKNGVLIFDRTGENYAECNISIPVSYMGKHTVYDIIMSFDYDEPIKFSATVSNWTFNSEQTGGWL